MNKEKVMDVIDDFETSVGDENNLVLTDDRGIVYNELAKVINLDAHEANIEGALERIVFNAWKNNSLEEHGFWVEEGVY